MIGVTPMKRMSAAIAVRASGIQTIRSPGVCAGPTSIRRTSRPPTSSPGERAGWRHKPHLVELERAKGLTDIGGNHSHVAAPRVGQWHRSGCPQGAGQGSEALHLGRRLGFHHRRCSLGGDDLRLRELLVSPPVVAIGVGVDERLDRRRLDQRAIAASMRRVSRGSHSVSTSSDAPSPTTRPALLSPSRPFGCSQAWTPAPTSASPPSNRVGPG